MKKGMRRADRRGVKGPLLAALFFATSLASAAIFGSCGGENQSSTSSAGSNAGGSSAGGSSAGGSSTGGGTSSDYPCDKCPEFPPLGAPQCDPKELAAPKLVYPLDGVLLPPNMNVLEVQFIPPDGATLFEVDFENSVTQVKVETQCSPVPDVRGGMSRGCGVTLPQGAWNDIANTNRDGDPVKVTVRATASGSCVSSSEEKINILFAKEDLAGGIYYWQSAVYGGIGGKTGGIYSHDFGSFDPTPTPFYTSEGTGTCVGCHNVSRDGVRMSLGTDDPDADDEFGDVKSHVLDIPTRAVVGGSKMSPGFQTWAHDHSFMVASDFKGAQDKSFDVYDENGVTLLVSPSELFANSLKATQPDLSRDDSQLVLVVPDQATIAAEGDHHFKRGALYTATFDPATKQYGPLTAALKDGTRNFYYPSISPDGSFIVFNDAPDAPDTETSNGDAFYNRNARVKLLHNPPGASAAPIDLARLNIGDGLSNSWPRWSPFVTTYKGKKLLWVTFSSIRDYGLHLVNQDDPANPGKPYNSCYPPESPAYDLPQPLTKQGVGYEGCASPQIWMAAIVIDPDPALDAADRSFPAFWLPFQDVNSHNHSAQWVEQIPPGMMPDGGTDGGGCAGLGEACGSGCCPNVVCCDGTCKDFDSCVK